MNFSAVKWHSALLLAFWARRRHLVKTFESFKHKFTHVRRARDTDHNTSLKSNVDDVQPLRSRNLRASPTVLAVSAHRVSQTLLIISSELINLTLLPVAHFSTLSTARHQPPPNRRRVLHEEARNLPWWHPAVGTTRTIMPGPTKNSIPAAQSASMCSPEAAPASSSNRRLSAANTGPGLPLPILWPSSVVIGQTCVSPATSMSSAASRASSALIGSCRTSESSAVPSAQPLPS